MLKVIGPFELLGLALGFAASCTPTRANQGHCEVQDGDSFCAEKYEDGSRRFCARGIPGCELEQLDGCVATRPADDACYSPCGGRKSLEDDPACEGQADGSSSSDTMTSADVTSAPTGEPTTTPTTTEPMSTTMSTTDGETEDASSSTTSSGCTESSECADAASPICVDTVCVPCTDAALPDQACAAADSGVPVCHDDGACVACTPSNPSACVDETPVCNAALNTCEGCNFHEQCAASACDIATGACFDEDCVVEVDGDMDAMADYDNVQEAIADGCVVIVHELDGELPYNENLTISGDTVVVLAAPGENPIIVGVGGNPSLSLVSGATAYVQGLNIRGNTMAEGITADASSLYLDRSQVVGNTGGGIVLTSNADGHLRNCFVGGFSDVVAMTVDASSAAILYSTLGGQFDAPALACIDPTSVTVRNSIVVSRAITSDIDCDDAEITYSATEFFVPGTGNVALGDMDMADATAWFDGYNGGNFGLNNPPAAILTAAQWQLGDPPTDIDGALRPTQDGTSDVAGADLP